MPKWRIGIILWMCNLSQEKTVWNINLWLQLFKIPFHRNDKLFTRFKCSSKRNNHSMLSWKHSKFFTTRHDKIIVRCHQIFNRMHSLQELHVREHLLCNSVPGTIAMGEIPLPFYREGDRRYQLLARMS